MSSTLISEEDFQNHQRDRFYPTVKTYKKLNIGFICIVYKTYSIKKVLFQIRRRAQ